MVYASGMKSLSYLTLCLFVTLISVVVVTFAYYIGGIPIPVERSMELLHFMSFVAVIAVGLYLVYLTL